MVVNAHESRNYEVLCMLTHRFDTIFKLMNDSFSLIISFVHVQSI